MNIDTNILNKILPRRIQQHKKSIEQLYEVRFSPDMQTFSGNCVSCGSCASIHSIYHNN